MKRKENLEQETRIDRNWRIAWEMAKEITREAVKIFCGKMNMIGKWR